MDHQNIIEESNVSRSSDHFRKRAEPQPYFHQIQGKGSFLLFDLEVDVHPVELVDSQPGKNVVGHCLEVLDFFGAS